MLHYSENPVSEKKLQRSKNKNQKSNFIKKEIRLRPQELSLLQEATKRHNSRLTVFIKQAALAYIQGVYILPDNIQIKHFERSLRQVSNAVHYIAQHAHEFSTEQFQELQDLITLLEKSLHDIFYKPQKLETLLKEIVKEHPNLHQWLKIELKKIEKVSKK